MYKIHLANQNVTVEVEGGTLAAACDAAGYPLNLVCGGKGTCGKCRVEIECGGERSEVLACLTEVTSDLKVWVGEDSLSRDAVILTGSTARDKIRLAPAVQKEYHTKADLYPGHCEAFFAGAGHSVMKKFSRAFNRKDCEGLTLVLSEGRLLDVQDGDTAACLYGGAVDIGTTTVVLYVYDLQTGELLDTESELNAQIAHGADVVARILYSQEREEALAELHEKVIGTINGLLAKAEAKVPQLSRDLYHLVLCGNSTMQHLFLQLDPGALGVKPFVNITADTVETTAQELGLKIPALARVTFLPLLGGFVGADTTAVLLTLPEDEKKYLMIDLGTNGEIAVGNQHRYLTSSTACGPALEGGNIECGMRGTDGAIEKVEISEEEGVKVRTIGGAEAKGICGSGIIDAVAEMIGAGLISKAGHLLSAEEFQKKHPESGLHRYIRPLDEERHALFLTDKVYICQNDISQIQLAKSAIYSGCVTLLAEYGIGVEDLDALVLAGAFGNYIDVDKALEIGLLPGVPREKVLSVGNGAGLGVQMCLLDAAEMERCAAIPQVTEHVELADSPMFMKEYVKNMGFRCKKS